MPRLFEEFARSDPGERPHRGRNRATVKDYKAERHHMELCEALDHFREQQTIEQFGLSRLKNTGPSVIMSNAVLKRIVDCAHAGKIKSKDDLQLETRWSRASTFADTILSLITTHCPAPSLAPLPVDLLAPALSNVVPTRIHTCGACGEKGHNSKSIAALLSLFYSNKIHRGKQEMPQVCSSPSPF